MPQEDELAGLPEEAREAEEAQQRRECWGWVEPGVWTDRMLATLAEQGLFTMTAAFAAARQSR